MAKQPARFLANRKQLVTRTDKQARNMIGFLSSAYSVGLIVYVGAAACTPSTTAHKD